MSNIKEVEIKTKTNNIPVVLKSAITYGDNQEIMDVYRDEKLSKKESIQKADQLGIEKIIVSINGSTENIYQTFRNLPYPDALEIVEEMSKVLDPKKAEGK